MKSKISILLPLTMLTILYSINSFANDDSEKIKKVNKYVKIFDVPDNVAFDYNGKSGALYDMNQHVYKENLNREKIIIPQSEELSYSSIANNYNQSKMAFLDMRSNFNFINYSDLIDNKGFSINKGYAYPYFAYNYKKQFYNYVSLCAFYKEYAKVKYNEICYGSETTKSLPLKSKQIDENTMNHKYDDYFKLLEKNKEMNFKIALAIKNDENPEKIKTMIDSSYQEYFEYYKNAIKVLKKREFLKMYESAKKSLITGESAPNNYRFIIEQTSINLDDHS